MQLSSKGADVKRGDSEEANPKTWVLYLKNFIKTCDSFIFAEESFLTLLIWCPLCRAEGTKVHTFFNPIPEGLLILIWYAISR